MDQDVQLAAFKVAGILESLSEEVGTLETKVTEYHTALTTPSASLRDTKAIESKLPGMFGEISALGTKVDTVSCGAHQYGKELTECRVFRKLLVHRLELLESKGNELIIETRKKNEFHVTEDNGMRAAEGNSFFKSPVLYARKQTSSKPPWFPSVTKLLTSFIYIMFLALVLIVTIISAQRSTSMVHSWNNATAFDYDHTMYVSTNSKDRRHSLIMNEHE